MLTTVDRANGFIIQKVTTPKGKFLRYQAVEEQNIGDATGIVEFPTLEAAREGIGHRIVAKVNLTAPKASYSQNQPGYKAPPGTGKTEQLGKTRHKK